VPSSSSSDDDGDENHNAISHPEYPANLRSFKNEPVPIIHDDKHPPRSISECSSHHSAAAIAPQAQGGYRTPSPLSYTSGEGSVTRRLRSDSLSSVETITPQPSNAVPPTPLARPSTPITISSDSEPDNGTITVEVDDARSFRIPSETQGARPVIMRGAQTNMRSGNHPQGEQGTRPLASDYIPDAQALQAVDSDTDTRSDNQDNIMGLTDIPEVKRHMRAVMVPFRQHLQDFWDEYDLSREESMRLLRYAMWDVEGVRERHPGGLPLGEPDAGMISFCYLMLVFSTMQVLVPPLDYIFTLTGWQPVSFLFACYALL
jgi:hypothetical protein